MGNPPDSGAPISLREQLAALRVEYQKAALDESHCAASPIIHLETWLHEARQAQIHEANAVVLSTVDNSGYPSSRAVLLKDIRDGALVFFTNYQSKKARDIESCSRVAMLFLWPELERQVRLQGIAQKVSREESEKYFSQRPRASQLAAYASTQSAVLESRGVLEAEVARVAQQFSDKPVPCPQNWGGYAVAPHYAEFWQGRESRLHDRLCYSLGVDGQWELHRLWP
jgi:pyridoxamine 5'-phosphate oxidase